MDRLNGLAVLVAAVDGGSLAAAARRLAMTPAMAGKHLAAMEAALGVRLLHRTTRQLRPTEAGQRYCQQARHILSALDEADRAATASRDAPRGILRLSAPAAFGALHLGGPIAAFIRRYPEVTVDMNLDDRFADLVADRFDLAIRIGTLPDSGLMARRLATTGMVACAAPAFLAGCGRPKGPADLDRFDRLAFSRAVSPGDWSFTDRDGHVSVAAGPVRLRADDVQLLLAAAAAGAGIVYGPSFVLGDPIAAGTLERVLPDHATPSLGIHAVFPSARLVDPKLRRFIELLQHWFAAVPRWHEPPAPVATPSPPAARRRTIGR